MILSQNISPSFALSMYFVFMDLFWFIKPKINPLFVSNAKLLCATTLPNKANLIQW
jgi:hypothetical protein